jgi:sugar lactone lactonase YvrE
MYFADSERPKIWAFDYDADAGEASAERLFATPCVVRYTPQGKVDRVLAVPAKEPTCCCFGSAALDTLYITTANGAGVWATRPGSTGLPEARFKG